jgi:cold shock protein
VTSTGIVREWREDEGFGVVDSPGTPGGCWVHFSNIVADGYRSLRAGDYVTFTSEPASQDGFEYRAILVWPPGVQPGRPLRPADEGTDGAYQSTLTIGWERDQPRGQRPDGG